MSLSSVRLNQPALERAAGALDGAWCGTTASDMKNLVSSGTADRRAQARVDDGVEDIDHEVNGDEDQRNHQQVRRHDRDIDVLDRLHEQQTHAGPLEHGFGDDRKSNYRTKL